MMMKAIILILPIMISVAFITLVERKVLSFTGLRQGPNKVSIQGILQPLSDALKLSNKSINYLSNYSMFIYYLSVLIMMIFSLIVWSTLNFLNYSLSWKFSILILMLMLAVTSMKAIMAGWSTYGKYSLIGSMRTVSQMISYESVLYLCLLSMVWCMKSFKMSEIYFQKLNMMIMIMPLCIMFWTPSVLAELNRSPYDFSEGESELVSGFNTEFGSSSFTMIFLSEYMNIMFFMTMTSMIFINTKSSLTFFLSVIALNFWVIWMRSTLPRMRFDKFMMKAWKFYIPFMTTFMIMLITEI